MVSLFTKVQKQPPEVFCRKRCSWKFRKIDFITKQPLVKAFSCEFCEIFKNTFFTEHLLETAFVKLFQHRCFPVNITKFLRTHILKKICERLLLNVVFRYNYDIFIFDIYFMLICIILILLCLYSIQKQS